jgi:cytochrome c oxidase assembly protein Cox11
VFVKLADQHLTVQLISEKEAQVAFNSKTAHKKVVIKPGETVEFVIK